MKDIIYALPNFKTAFAGNFLLMLLIMIGINSEIEAQIYSSVESPEIKSAGGTPYGAGWIDYNDDGYADIWVNYYDQQIRLFVNNKDGSFTQTDIPVLSNLGTNHSGITWGDYDNDGFPDMFITTLQGNNTLLKSTGNGNFTIENTPPVSDVHIHCSWVDYDNDGWLDLFIPTSANFNFAGGTTGTLNHLLHNNGNGSFSSVIGHSLTSERGNNQSANFSDIDNDGDMDLFISEWDLDNWLFENNGDGTFTRITGGELSSNTSTSMSSCWGDFNNDGFMDLYVGNGNNNQAVTQKNLLYLNNGDKTFRKITMGDAVNNEGCTWTCLTGDVDNDGDLDLFAGDLFFPNSIFLNDGTGNFTKDSAFNIQSSGASGACFGDYNNDGFLDLFVPDVIRTSIILYNNNGNENNWINIKCKGTVSNRSAIGAKVKVKAHINGSEVWQIREITGSQGFRSFNDLKVHFGLADAEVIDSLIVEWPSGQQSVSVNVAVNNSITITEEVPFEFLSAQFKADKSSGYSPLEVHFSEISTCNENNPITSWSWDFDGDGIEDSKEKNPVYTFTADETKDFTVSLTVVNGSKTITTAKENYIHVLPIHLQNIALLKQAAASTNRPIHVAPNIVDGKKNTIWWSQPADTQWVCVELDSIYTLGKIIIYWGSNFAERYTIQTSQDSITWTNAAEIDTGNGKADEIVFNTIEAKYFRFLLFQPSGRYGYNIQEIEIYRHFILTGTPDDQVVPTGFNLWQNYPNPFNPVTTIQYSLGGTGHTSLKIYDILGKEIAVLVNEEKPAGIYRVEFNGSGLSSGVYFYSLYAGEFAKTNKFILLK